MVRRFLLLNGLSIVSVILFHSAGWGFTAMYSWVGRYMPGATIEMIGRSPEYYGLNALVQFGVFAIPAFLFVSGYFASVVYSRLELRETWKRLWPRVSALVVPYLVWSSVALAGRVAEGRLGFLPNLPAILLTGGATPAYYYVPVLIQLYILAPLLIRWARRRPFRLLVVFSVLQLAIYTKNYAALVWPDSQFVGSVVQVMPKWLFVSYLFWFSAGILASMHIHLLERWAEIFRRVAGYVVAGLFLMGYLEWELLGRWTGQLWMPHYETLVDCLYSAAVILAVLGWVSAPRGLANWLNALGERSYGIYLIHPIVMEYTARGIYRLVPEMLSKGWFVESMLITLGLGVPVLMISVVRRSRARVAYPFLFG